MRGQVPPSVFIPVAEDAGVIDDIGRFVLEAACQRASTWPITSSRGGPIVTVNASVCQLIDDRLLRDVTRALERSGLPADRLALEITESLALENPDDALAVLERLSGLGIHLMIDDFGAGYSSLGHLHRMPVSVVKIDRQFVQDLWPGSPGEAVVASVVQLARGLGLTVVAEGVETVEHLTQLKGLNCDAVQGYGLSRPLDPDDLDLLLQGRPVQIPEIPDFR